MVLTVHNNYTKLMRWMRCRWEWCLPARPNPSMSSCKNHATMTSTSLLP